MRWVISYQKGSFSLQESFDLRAAATERVIALSYDTSVWSVTVKDSVSGAWRIIPRHAGQTAKDLELE